MRAAGQDPYAYEKAKIADSTREQRVCMAVKARDERLANAFLELTSTMEAILSADVAWPAHREAIFDLWDDCTHPGQEGAKWVASARATIVSFIRKRLPVGSRNAFSLGELAQLNRRRKTLTILFDPYGG